MNAVEFYKMSIKEFPNHKDRGSLKYSVTELQKEIQSESRFIDRYEDTEYDEKIFNSLLKILEI